jgi:hypothetical protein
MTPTQRDIVDRVLDLIDNLADLMKESTQIAEAVLDEVEDDSTQS